MIVKVLRTVARDQNNWKVDYFKEGHPTVSIPDLLAKLNCIIEWEFCKWPLKEGSETERDEKYLGDVPEFKPGDAFSLGGNGNLQVIRIIDNDTIGLEHTETTGLALTRIWEEQIKPEIELFFNSNTTPSQIEIEDIDTIFIPADFTASHQIPSYLYKLWRDRCLYGRDWLKENHCLKIVNQSEFTIFPVTYYLTGYRILFNPQDLEGMGDDFVKGLIWETMDWFYNNYTRTGVEPDTIPQSDEMKAMMESIGLSSMPSVQPSSAVPIVTQSIDNSSSDELDEDFGEFNPNEIYHYAVRKDGEDEELGEPGELYLYLVKKSIWDQEGVMESSSLDPRFEDMYIPEFSEAMEGVYEVPDKFKTIKEVYSHLSTIPVFEFNQDFEDFINNCN